jgi:hypothetical protein
MAQRHNNATTCIGRRDSNTYRPLSGYLHMQPVCLHMQLNCFLENTMKNRLATTLIATTALASSFATSAASTQNDSLKPVYSGQ